MSPKDKTETDNNKKAEKKPILMTRRELTDPFGSDDEDTPETPENNSKIMENAETPLVNGNNEIDKDDGKELPKPNLVRT